MKPARLIVLGIALLSGLFAFFLTKRSRAPEVIQVAETVEAPVKTNEILVASGDIPVGRVVQASDLKWENWPSAGLSGQVIARKDSPKALDEAAGSIARGAFVAGEPIRAAKLIKADGKGFMAAILQPGMRAVATEVAPESGAGGFILPNDRVDVILTRRLNATVSQRPDELTHSASTVLNNVRVLAIDQSVEDRSRDRAVIGRTATLELSPQQAEVLALARQLGMLSLSLRSLSESGKPATDGENPLLGSGSKGLTIVKFGMSSSSQSAVTSPHPADPNAAAPSNPTQGTR